MQHQHDFRFISESFSGKTETSVSDISSSIVIDGSLMRIIGGELGSLFILYIIIMFQKRLCKQQF